jgi:hypothetical protein
MARLWRQKDSRYPVAFDDNVSMSPSGRAYPIDYRAARKTRWESAAVDSAKNCLLRGCRLSISRFLCTDLPLCILQVFRII